MTNAKELLAEKGAGTDDKVLANMAIAKSAQMDNQCESAITNYRSVASLSKSAYGAEARYEIANCFFSQNRYADAEKAAFEVIKKSGSYEEWVTRAYILLGDIYYKQKDYFNSKATYRSVVDNAKIESLRQEAERKLKQVTDEEGKSSKVEGIKFELCHFETSFLSFRAKREICDIFLSLALQISRFARNDRQVLEIIK